MCRTGGPRCTGEGRRRLDAALAHVAMVEAQIRDGDVSVKAIKKLVAARERLAAAQHEYDLTKGGLEDLQAAVEACSGDGDRAVLQARLDAARVERERLLAQHRGVTDARWGWDAWATPQVLDAIDELGDMQGHDPAETALLAQCSVSAPPTQNPRPLTRVSKGVNETYECVLNNGVHGYHKPFDGVDQVASDMYGQTDSAGRVVALQPIHEAAAWQFAKRLGGVWRRIVCPCVIRDVGGRMGSFSEKSHLPRKGGVVVDSPEFRAAAFFDVLVGQQDRNRGNFFTDGVGGPQVSLYDHGFCFARPGDFVNEGRLAGRFAGELLSAGERDALKRVLASSDLFGLRRVLEVERADAVEDRARRMLAGGVLIDVGDF